MPEGEGEREKKIETGPIEGEKDGGAQKKRTELGMFNRVSFSHMYKRLDSAIYPAARITRPDQWEKSPLDL